MTRRLTILALCAALLAGLAGAASASTRLQAGLQLAQSERYRPRGRSYDPPSSRRRRSYRRRNNDNRYNRYNRGRRGSQGRSPGTLNYGRGRGGVLPMGEVVPNVRRAVGGQVLRGGLRGSQYWFRVLTRDGRVVDVYADARTGRITRIRGAR